MARNVSTQKLTGRTDMKTAVTILHCPCDIIQFPSVFSESMIIQKFPVVVGRALLHGGTCFSAHRFSNSKLSCPQRVGMHRHRPFRKLALSPPVTGCPTRTKPVSIWKSIGSVQQDCGVAVWPLADVPCTTADNKQVQSACGDRDRVFSERFA